MTRAIRVPIYPSEPPIHLTEARASVTMGRITGNITKRNRKILLGGAASKKNCHTAYLLHFKAA